MFKLIDKKTITILAYKVNLSGPMCTSYSEIKQNFEILPSENS